MHKLVKVVSEICFSDKKIKMLFKDWSVSETTIYETRYVLGDCQKDTCNHTNMTQKLHTLSVFVIRKYKRKDDHEFGILHVLRIRK